MSTISGIGWEICGPVLTPTISPVLVGDTLGLLEQQYTSFG